MKNKVKTTKPKKKSIFVFFIKNIIFGNIELIGENPIGGLVAIVSGSGENIRRAVDFLREKKVGVEVLADARVS